MKAIIPAAGAGTRLRPHTYTVPKILINVAGKPMISYLIDELLTVKELDTIIMIVGHLGEQVESYIKTVYAKKTKIEFKFIEQSEMKGLGHAVYQAADLLKTEPVVIILGDTIFEFELKKLLSSKESAIGVKDVEDPKRFGVVETINGYISKMIEKPSGPSVTTSRKAIAGLYYIKNSDALVKSLKYIIDHNITTKNEYQLTDALQNMIENGEKIVPFEIQNWFDCGKPETLLSTNKYLLVKYYSTHKHRVYPSTLIIPPVYIGQNCHIVNSIVGPYTTIGNEVYIKESILNNSLVGDYTSIEKSILQDSIIGSEVVISGKYQRLYTGDNTEISF